MAQVTYTILLVRQEEGYTVRVPALPGCITQGNSLPEAIENAHEAIELYLEVILGDNKPIPADKPVIELYEWENEALAVKINITIPEVDFAKTASG